jgi:peptidoglycan/LPS O-acetylase OafA/YrhL
VELFFVLSGFLITGILLDAKGAPRYFINFYTRRFLRIFPLYYATLLLVFVAAPLLFIFDQAAHDIARRQGWLWSYLANLPISGDHWDASETFMVGHFWSLCVEEHYYLVWPALVMLFSKRHLANLCVALLGIAFSFRCLDALIEPHSVWLPRWTTITKLDGLALGSLVAILVRQAQPGERFNWAVKSAIIFGLGFLALALVPRRMHETSLVYRLCREPIAVGFFASWLLLALRSGSRGLLGSLLAQSWLMTFGKYSYGIYVIHGLIRPELSRLFPIEKLLGMLRSPILAQFAYYILATGLTLVLALLSYHLLERRFLDLKTRFSTATTSRTPVGGPA